jgi:hypothetical protein
MDKRDDLHRSEDLDGAGDHMNAAGDHTSEAARHAGEAARHTKEAMQAGASGTMDRARETAAGAGRAAGNVADGAKDAAAGAARAAGSAAGSAKHAVASAAGTVGSTVKGGAKSVASAASAVSGAVGAAASRIAGKVGGWWESARHAAPELPDVELEALRTQFAAYEAAADDFTVEVAATAYALGYLAAQNPEYQGRQYEHVEPDLRHGFFGDSGTYHAWRDFSRSGYDSGGRR